jgi:arginine deiminase
VDQQVKRVIMAYIAHMKAGARAEWHQLRHIMVHEPGLEVFFALLAPASHLYERFFDLGKAISEHRELCRMLHEDYGVVIHHLEATVEEKALNDPYFFDDLASLAAKRVSSQCEGEVCSFPKKLQRDMINPEPLAQRDPGHLFNIIKFNPRLTIHPKGVKTMLEHPLYNLYFMRDQQAATDRGMVLGRISSAERAGEVALARLGLKAAGASPVYEVEHGSFEGGDFIPAGNVALVGCGPRTTRQGIFSLMKGMSFDEVAVVKAPVHPLVQGHDPMISMHLDTYFNILSGGVAVGSPPLLETAKVEIYQRNSDSYESAGTGGNLLEFITKRGFDLVRISTLEQLCYASNFLCTGDLGCIAPDTGLIAPQVLQRLKEKESLNPGKYQLLLSQAQKDYEILKNSGSFFPKKPEIFSHGIETETAVLTNATGGYGGAHCMICVLSR